MYLIYRDISPKGSYSFSMWDSKALSLGSKKPYSISGLVLFWKDHVDISILSFPTGHIDYCVGEGGSVWFLMGFYGHPRKEMRWQSWELLRRLVWGGWDLGFVGEGGGLF